LFALFQQLSKGKRLDSLIEVADIMELVLQTVNNLQDQYGNGEISYFNICLTDGKRLLATRYCTEGEPASLHYAQGSQFLKRDDGRYHMLQQDGGKNCVLVASEKLNDFDMEWKDVPKNHFLLVDEQFNIVTRPINL
jgi:glutamine amidotransferase